MPHPLFGHYHNAPKLGRVGMAYFETMGQPELRAIYYDKAMEKHDMHSSPPLDGLAVITTDGY
jgi:hypothetical protein